MIIHSVVKALPLRKFPTILLLSFHFNKTYGSINKPISRITKDSKSTPLQKSSIPSNLESKNLISQDDPSDSQINDNAQQNYNKIDGFSLKKNKQMAFFFKLNEEEQLNIIEEFRQKQMLKELSIICRQMYFYRVQSDAVWEAIEKAFIYFLHPPYDQQKARPISHFLLGLAKSKRNSRNYTDEMMEVLPFCTIKSFTQIIYMIFRMGTMNHKFMELVEQLYYKRKQEAGPKQLCLLNYSLAKSGRKIDTSIAEKLDSFNLREITLMLKAFDISGNMNQELLKKCAQLIVSQKYQAGSFDLRFLLKIYLKHQYFENFHLWHYFDEQFRFLSQIPRSISEDFIQNVWPYFPQAINKNKLPPSLVEGVLKKLGQLKRANKIKVNKLAYIEAIFDKIQNKEVREKLKKMADLK